MLSKNQILSARKAVEALYTGTCTVTERRNVRDEKTKLTCTQEEIVLEDQPCRLSFETLKTAGAASPASGLSQPVKLFLAPEIEVKPGSRITVTQNGVTTDYQRSGVPAAYLTHQEISLERFEGWA